ncbi:MAG: hypothetical protein RIQ79_2700 [Verrucomicrobiota bacterium]
MGAKPERDEHAQVNWRYVGWLTVAAVAIYVLFRLLPTGTNLHHMDFRVEGKGALEMCDPSRPQFIPVVAARSPVTLRLDRGAGANEWLLNLATVGGKPIGPEDLLTVHTQKLHLLVVDQTLADYQHLHPEPGSRPGEWRFTHVPKIGGVYRVFADFTPAATGRGLYAFADYEAPGAGGKGRDTGGTTETWSASVGQWVFNITPGAADGIRAGQPTTLRFAVRSTVAGGEVPLEPVMDAYAHLVAFDIGRTGFAHLHPRAEEQARRPDATRPELNFDLMIPQPGRYVIWAQVRLTGEMVFAPFRFEVKP